MSDFTPSTPSTPSTPLLDSAAVESAAAADSPSSGSSSPSDGGGAGGSSGGRWCKLSDNDGGGDASAVAADAAAPPTASPDGARERSGGGIISRRTRYGGDGDRTSGGGDGGCVDDLLARYNSLLDAHPLATKSLTAAFVQGLGAALASLWKNGGGGRDSRPRGGKGSVDWLTVFAFALHGGLVNGPVGHYWFEFLSKHGPKSTFKSMLLDQIVASPSLLVLMFVFLDTSKAAMREVGPSMRRTLSTVGPTILTSWRFWPIAVLCTFRYLKKKHYTVALNLCSLAWTMYLSKNS